MRKRLIRGDIRPVDSDFCELMRKYSPEMSSEVSNLIADLSYALSQQHSCIDLKKGDSSLIDELRTLAIVGDGETPTPLVMRGHKLYLHRYYQYEKLIAHSLRSRNKIIARNNIVSANNTLDINPELTTQLIEYFGEPGRTVDWQQIAALQALTRQLTIITGGPGTGKTSTVVKILAILLGQENSDGFIIKLAAPTGKAAMRLAESIHQFLPQLPEEIRSKIPSEVLTIHRLLGMRGNGRSFRHNRDNPIVADLLIVDEISMVDLTLMYRLLDALPPQTRLLLLGDPEQLPSVEAGNVLADLCHGEPGYSAEFAIRVKEHLGVDIPVRSQPHPLVDAMCHFEKSYRFSHDRGIGQLANKIRSGETHLTSSEDDEVRTFDLDSLAGTHRRREITSYYFEYEMLIQDPEIDPLALLTSFEQTRILCPVRDGDLGIESLNGEIECYLEEKGLKSVGQQFYHGRPIIITRNDYNLGLFNGDIGICIFDASNDQIKTAFLDSTGGVKLYLASRLPPHETCFAMTVHKSQGSEFDHVTLILPRPVSDATEQLLTRELVYTAITRARHSIAIYADEETWSAALTRRVQRMSGISSFLEFVESNDEQLDLF